MKLMQLSDRDILNQIESPTMSMETLDIIGEAIHQQAHHRKLPYLVRRVYAQRRRLAQAADYVLNLEGVTAVAVFGLNEEKIHISARSKDIRVNIGAVMSEAFGDIGSAGGHSNGRCRADSPRRFHRRKGPNDAAPARRRGRNAQDLFENWRGAGRITDVPLVCLRPRIAAFHHYVALHGICARSVYFTMLATSSAMCAVSQS